MRRTLTRLVSLTAVLAVVAVIAASASPARAAISVTSPPVAAPLIRTTAIGSAVYLSPGASPIGSALGNPYVGWCVADGYPAITYGSVGMCVRAAQWALGSLLSSAGGSVDGNWGRISQRAMRFYQGNIYNAVGRTGGMPIGWITGNVDRMVWYQYLLGIGWNW